MPVLLIFFTSNAKSRAIAYIYCILLSFKFVDVKMYQIKYLVYAFKMYQTKYM